MRSQPKFFAGLVTLSLLAAQPPATSGSYAAAPSPTTAHGWCGYFPGSTSSTVVKGATTRVGGGLRANDEPINGQTLHLWAKPWSKPWRPIATATTGPTGNTSATHVPRFNTTYLWKFPGTPELAASTSNYVTVRVSTTVTMRLSDSSLKPGQTAVAYGRTLPAKPGVTATLWRRFPGYSVKLSSGRIRADGTYRLTKRVSAGAFYWTLYVTVPAASGNARGTSPNRQVKIS